jgi:hypothetical protein
MSVPTYRDGNSLAGPFADILALEPTTAWRRCPQCRLVSPMAELRVYGTEAGLTGRCPGCDGIAVRLVRQPEHVWLQLGSPQAAFRFDLPA